LKPLRACFGPITRLSTRLSTILLSLWALPIAAESRFPKPDFTKHSHPEQVFIDGKESWMAWADVGILALFLLIGIWLTHRVRSRAAVVALGLAAVAYFGFWKLGCVCPIGGIQNVAHAAVDGGTTLPLTILLIVALPLVVALFFGRVFCGTVCPFGVMQELVILKPLRLPSWLAAALTLIPVIYLVVALAMAATGAGYPICRYDPFVGFFRLDGFAPWLLTGAGLLLLGTVIARPYCRFLCPYGVLLGWASRFAKHPVTTSPTTCITCHLCADSCPMQALRPPGSLLDQGDPKQARRTVAALLILLPVLVLGGGAVGWLGGHYLAPAHKTVQLGLDVIAVREGRMEPTLDTDAFAAGEVTVDTLIQRGRAQIRRMSWAGAIFGALLGLFLGMRLLRLTRHIRDDDWVPDQGACVACARCFDFCPLEQQRRHGTDPDELINKKTS
jgi:NosR/NirI family transcriptional regulator, nitrous oxide reductase regulator